ncbi:hypothetical protein HXX76_002769 [Chlamydomonas incerta]|uniref:HVA22-like protein n=1 Tax=Chlamydomonas incerta TaxID=51695 RepID=A0A835TP84_CHLIN|nr:hypothetical protein HXX76_002769 [Chlamydomonas incerta]|eukprot:KAG2442686.1 hypothetical protein HXX76_002769 [Chlamydomonas incerta]
MRTISKSDDNQWLAYWVVHACMSVLEGVGHAVLPWIPLYYEAKLLFVLWMTLPQTQGARMIYEDILTPRLEAWERQLRGQGQGQVQQPGGPGPRPGPAAGAAAAKARREEEADAPAGAAAAARYEERAEGGGGGGGSSKVGGSLKHLFHRTHKSEGAAGAAAGGLANAGGSGSGAAAAAALDAQGSGGGGMRAYSPLSANLQQL